MTLVLFFYTLRPSVNYVQGVWEILGLKFLRKDLLLTFRFFSILFTKITLMVNCLSTVLISLALILNARNINFFSFASEVDFVNISNFLRLKQNCSNLDLTSDKTIEAILKKMGKDIDVSEADYVYISNFLLKNVDESFSEEIGFTLFEYLKGNGNRNKIFASVFKTKDITYKNKVLKALIQVMCIDLGEEKYTYVKLLKDFSIFEGSSSVKTAFDTCLSNLVD